VTAPKAFAFQRAPKPQPEESSGQTPIQVAATAPAGHGPVHIESEADFNARVIDAGRVCLVDLFSNRRTPCRTLAPDMSLFARQYAGRAIICRANVDELLTLAEWYQVSAIPTVLIIKDGKLPKPLMRLRGKTESVAVPDKLLNEKQ